MGCAYVLIAKILILLHFTKHFGDYFIFLTDIYVKNIFARIWHNIFSPRYYYVTRAEILFGFPIYYIQFLYSVKMLDVANNDCLFLF